MTRKRIAFCITNIGRAGNFERKFEKQRREINRRSGLEILQEPVCKKGSAGDSPAPVGDPPSGTVERTIAKKASPSIWIVVVVPSGESPDGTRTTIQIEGDALSQR
jgi:hypothetical protein